MFKRRVPSNWMLYLVCCYSLANHQISKRYSFTKYHKDNKQLMYWLSGDINPILYTQDLIDVMKETVALYH